MNTERVCQHRWWAPRVEVESMPVQHVCGEPLDHAGVHLCACGAKSE